MPASINSKKTIGVIGSNGLLGSDLVKFLQKDYKVEGINKENYDALRGKQYDVVINANGNSKRFWANQNILADFEASTCSVYKSLIDFPCAKYIYMSSSDVYPHHESIVTTKEDEPIHPKELSPYGFHKYLSEQIVKHAKENHVILRSSMILGRNLRKGPIFDILNGHSLFITPDSRLQMITTRAIAEIICTITDKKYTGITINIGGKGAISFDVIHKYLQKEISVAEKAERQEYEMNVEKLSVVYDNLKTSEEYLKEFIHEYAKKI